MLVQIENEILLIHDLFRLAVSTYVIDNPSRISQSVSQCLTVCFTGYNWEKKQRTEKQGCTSIFIALCAVCGLCS
jgi:hypothetical protein